MYFDIFETFFIKKLQKGVVNRKNCKKVSVTQLPPYWKISEACGGSDE